MWRALINREDALQIIGALDPDEASSASEEIQMKWTDFFKASVKDVSKAALYRPIKKEIGLGIVERFLIRNEVELYYPRVTDKKGGLMQMQRVEDPFADVWQTGTFGIQEPPVESQICDPAELDLILIPGLVFDLEGHRLGRGRGFYDRYLAQVEKAVRVSLCHDFQISDRINPQSWDQSVNWIVTEKRIHLAG